MRLRRRLPAMRLWVKLALLAALGVVAMHAVHLVLGVRVATRALADEQEHLGSRLARTVAMQAADPLLVGDAITLQEIVARAADEAEGRVSYCFVIREGRVLASSFEAGTPAGLVTLRADEDLAPRVVVDGATRVLDLAAPVLDPSLAVVRLGLDMRSLDETRRRLAVQLGLLALGMVGAGLVAAFVSGRSIAQPVADLLEAADRFDPAAPGAAPTVAASGSLEVAVLADRFNRMMERLRAAHAEQARARQKSVETERLAALGSLVAGVAHEVNNPLAGMKNCLRRLERGDLPEPKRREYLALMDEGLVRIEDVVRSLLDFGRPQPLRLEPVEPRALVEGAAGIVRPLLDTRRISTRLLASQAVPRVRADRRLVAQAIVNLVLNAAYVTSDGGELRLRLRARDGLVGLAVEDDGPGIPPEVRDRILDPFFSTKPEGDGTGLGLSVTRSIVDAHAGELTFEFPDAGGTVATIWLPRV